MSNVCRGSLVVTGLRGATEFNRNKQNVSKQVLVQPSNGHSVEKGQIKVKRSNKAYVIPQSA